MTRVVIHGAAGRMGRRLVVLACEDERLTLVGAVESTGHSLLGQDVGVIAATKATGVLLTDSTPDQADVLVDFSSPAATRAMLAICRQKKVAMIVGTTGLSDQDHALIDQAALDIAVLQAPNMALGVNLLFLLAGQTAKRLGDDYDIEIVETHHRFKKDAPSGTALGVAEAICRATNKDMKRDVVYDRHGDHVPRKRGEIGMHALRSGDVIGEHTVSFAALGEQLRLTHIATDRDVFVHGALTAAKWLAAQTPGRYHMADVLGLA